MEAMTPTVLVAIAGFFVMYTATILGAAAWFQSQMKTLKEDILSDFDKKHDANNQRYDALHVLVIRHDTWLNPDFSRAGNGTATSRERHG